MLHHIHKKYKYQESMLIEPAKKTVKLKRRQSYYVDKLNKILFEMYFGDWDNMSIEKREELIYSDSRTFKGEMRLIALKRGGYRCAICGRTNKEATLEVDHIVPWSKGGRTAIANSRVLCKECNIAVSNKQKF